jgi:alanyl-tRNA synthetase
MRYLKSTEIRNMWLDYFKSKGHQVIESASLIPLDDDSLFFVNAGVTPLKKYFDGTIVPENKRLTSIQKCIRTNDIENVGVTKRHQTFFEMMGNFSVGDYFKEEALDFAFEFLTSPDWCGIPVDKLYCTIYMTDEAAYNKWISLGMIPDHIVRLPGNFWEIGSGPCGPDSEIFYDRGERFDKDGTALEKFKKDEDQERYIEIWNNVFSQYNSEPGVDRSLYKELPHKNIDTGAGLERWCCIFQDVDSNFDTDLFVPIINQIEQISGVEYKGESHFKIIADHIRAITMALSDGAVFENNNRGYVLRRLLRRSVRSGRKLGLNEPFMYKLVDTVVEIMRDSYPKLVETQSDVKALILNEEKLFHETLRAGERKLLELIKESKNKTISGYDAFKLYDTYGFPFELTLEYLQDENMTVDKEEFDKYMEEAKKVAKESRKQEAGMNIQNEALMNFLSPSEFLYDTYEIEDARVIGLFKDKEEVDKLDGDGYVVFDRTCFYAESGGQVADTGAIKNKKMKAKVIDVKKAPNGQHLHKIELLEGTIKVGDTCSIKIVEDKRLKTQANHSTIHIVQKVLQDTLSSDIHQAGSYVDYERLRFDFTYSGKISEESIFEIEDKVNEFISKHIKSKITNMSLDEAKRLGAMALFTDKYKDIVRVVQIGDSIELCGGTHIKSTDEINRFAILKVESKGSNLYRLEGCTNDMVPVLVSESVAKYVDEIKALLSKAKDILEKAKKEDIKLNFDVILDQKGLSSYRDIIYNKNQLEYIQNEVRNLEKQYDDEKARLTTGNLDKYLDKVKEINGVSTIVMEVKDMEMNDLKTIVDELINRLGKGIVFFANVRGNNVNFICKCNDVTSKAGLLVKKASEMANGKGGGSSTFAQGGASNSKGIKKILEEIKKDIKENN